MMIRTIWFFGTEIIFPGSFQSEDMNRDIKNKDDRNENA